MEKLFIGHIPPYAETGTYDLQLVILSYIIAVIASYSAFTLAERLIAQRNLEFALLLKTGSAISLGVGIWAMHFIGMLAFSQPMEMSYNIFYTVFSMVLAVAAAYGVFTIICRKTLSRGALTGAAFVLGAGICAMHYVGMAAMEMDAEIRYIPERFLLSFLIAVSASGLALWLLYHVTRLHTQYKPQIIAGCAIVMGAGICGMHYMGMSATVLLPYVDCRYADDQDFTFLAILVGVIAILVMLGTHFLRWFIDMWHPNDIGQRVFLQLISIFSLLLLVNLWGFSDVFSDFDSELVHMHGIAEELHGHTQKDKENVKGLLQYIELYIEGEQDEIIVLIFYMVAYVGIIFYAYRCIVQPLSDTTIELTNSRSFLRNIINAIPDPVFVKNRQHQWIMTNTAFLQLMNKSEEEIILKSDYDYFPKEQADIFWEGDEHVFNAGCFRNIEEITTGHGERRFIETTKTTYTGTDGEVYLVAILHDITEKRHTEQELDHHRNNLEKMVAEQTRDLILAREEERRARRQAEQANQLKSNFLSNMSHELRTPMHAIITFSRQGLERINRWTLEEHAENLSLIHSSGERLLLLLNDLLDLSKLESGTVVYNFKPTDIITPINIATSEIKGLAQKKSLTLTIDIEPDLPLIKVDNGKLVQVFINLFSNAIKFTAEGKKISVRCYAEPSDKKTMVIAVQDEGMGIPEDELRTVFDKFVQSSKSKTGAGGTGLGLAICREIIHAHKGIIWAENNTGEGTTFYVQLPIE